MPFIPLHDTTPRYLLARPWTTWALIAVSTLAFLFESVEGGSIIGRYSFLGMRPDLIWRCRGRKAEINRRARFDSGGNCVGGCS